MIVSLAIRGSIGTSSLTTAGFLLSEVPACAFVSSFASNLLQLYCDDAETNGSRTEGANGISFGGIYLSINTDIATTVNARSVPTLTYTRQSTYTLGFSIIHIYKSVLHPFYIREQKKPLGKPMQDFIKALIISGV